MEVLKKITAFVSRYMAIIVILVAALALFVPSSVSFLKTSYVNPLLGIVMFGMGLTLKPHDFKVVFSRPKDVIIGCCAQFAIMPFLAFALTKVFGLSPELAIGVILVGTCPGGTSSNVMTYLSKGDVALSVGMTACSTILAPFLTPALTYLYAGQTVDVDIWSMFLSIVQVVILPIVLGFLYLVFTKTISPAIPLTYVGSMFVFYLIATRSLHESLVAILSGGLLFGAVFMATDYVTSPFTLKGKLLYGVCLGIVTFAIRYWGTYTEGVSFALLFMNLWVPFINDATRQTPYGYIKPAKKAGKEGAGK